MKLVVWGASGHARSVADAIASARLGAIVAFLDDVNPVPEGATFLGKPLLAPAETLARLKKSGARHAVVAVGDATARLRIATQLVGFGFKLPPVVHRTAYVAPSAVVGPGTVVLARAVVGAAVRVGACAIVNTGAILDHDCEVGDGAHVCPGVVAGGYVRIGAGAWVGIGATLKDRVSIGSGTTVGAGAVVVGDLPGNVVAYGVPARVARGA